MIQSNSARLRAVLKGLIHAGKTLECERNPLTLALYNQGDGKTHAQQF